MRLRRRLNDSGDTVATIKQWTLVRTGGFAPAHFARAQEKCVWVVLLITNVSACYLAIRVFQQA